LIASDWVAIEWWDRWWVILHKNIQYYGISQYVYYVLEWNAIDFPVPHQKDGFNCGVFVIMNLYRMMKNVARNSPVETNHRKLFSSQEMVSIRKTLVDVCYRKAGLEELENFGIWRVRTEDYVAEDYVVVHIVGEKFRKV